MALTAAQRLAEAREAYHALNTGRLARVIVDQNGERVEFTSANRQALYSYIQELLLEAGMGVNALNNGPAGFVF
jgi:hypothetical protein